MAVRLIKQYSDKETSCVFDVPCPMGQHLNPGGPCPSEYWVLAGRYDRYGLWELTCPVVINGSRNLKKI